MCKDLHLIKQYPNKQPTYARRAKELGFAEAIHQEELDRENLLEVAGRLLSDPKYRKRFEVIASKGLSDGIENVLSEISEIIDE